MAYGSATRDCRSIDDLDAGIAGVTGARGILSTVIGVEVPLGCGMVFDSAEVGEALDGSEGAIGTGSVVGKLRGTVAPDAVPGEDFSADIEFFGSELQFGADAETTGKARIIVGADSTRRCGTIPHRPARLAWPVWGNSWP